MSPSPPVLPQPPPSAVRSPRACDSRRHPSPQEQPRKPRLPAAPAAQEALAEPTLSRTRQRRLLPRPWPRGGRPLRPSGARFPRVCASRLPPRSRARRVRRPAVGQAQLRLQARGSLPRPWPRGGRPPRPSAARSPQACASRRRRPAPRAAAAAAASAAGAAPSPAALAARRAAASAFSRSTS